jgi:hypothetical protein
MRILTNPTSPARRGRNGRINENLSFEPKVRDWRCRCMKLLGQQVGDRLEVRFARGHQYAMALPVSAVCRSCGRMNTLLPPTKRD